METDHQRYLRWFKQSKEVWFASSIEMYNWALKQNFLKPIWEIPGLEHLKEKRPDGSAKTTWFYTFVLKTDSRPEDLLRFFNSQALDSMGYFGHNINFEI